MNQSSSNKIKTAVIGVGSLGKHHVKWLHRLPESELVGVYDIDREKAEGIAGEYGVKVFDSMADVIAEAKAVTVVVPTTEHFKIASQLIENNIHCLIEKPVTSHLDDVNRLIALAEKHQVKVSVGHIERFNPAVRALESKKVRPSFIEAHRLAAFDPRGTDVAVVLDLMIHDIDLVLMFIKSNVVDIQASAVAVVSDQADIANARLTFENGAVANLTASRISLHPMRKIRLFQKSGYFSLDLAKKQADLYRLAGENADNEGMRFPLGKSGRDVLYQKINDDGEDMLGLELGHFLKVVAEDKRPAVTLSEAADALKIALEIEKIGVASIARMMAGA